MGKKVYAIKEGFDFNKNEKIENKIVYNWEQCLLYVKGVKNAKYKSFTDIFEAKEFLSNTNVLINKSEGNYPKDCMHIYVDGSYNMDTKKYSYGIVAVKEDIIEYIDSGVGNSNSDNNIRQIAGELKGAVKGVEYALISGEKKVVIFHDYAGICYHATGEWERREESSKEYYNKMQELMKKGIEIIFVKVDSHTGDLFNELVDEKCKEALNISSDKVVEKWLKKNILKVKSEELKIQVQSLISKNFENIVIHSNNNETKSQSDVLENKYEKIFSEYKNDKNSGKKLIKKLLSKEKEELILYLFDNKCNL